MTVNLLVGKNLCYRKNDKNILTNVNVEICAGERLCVVGRNGSGKTSLLKIMTKSVAPTSGGLEVGENVKVSFVPAEFHTLFYYTIEYFMVMELFYLHRGFPLEKHFSKCRKWLKNFLPELDPKAKLSTLSSGEKKIVLLARSFASNADVLIFDEPSTHLDLTMLERCKFYIRQETSKTFVIVDHNEKFLRDIASRFLIMEKGQMRPTKDLDEYLNQATCGAK